VAPNPDAFSVMQSQALASGFYLVNDTLGTKRQLQDTNTTYVLDDKPAIKLAHIKKVKLTTIKTKVFGKTEKRNGLLFTVNEAGKNKMQAASKLAYQNRQKMGFVLEDQLIVVFQINSELYQNTFFIDLEQPKDQLKSLEKTISAALK